MSWQSAMAAAARSTFSHPRCNSFNGSLCRTSVPTIYPLQSYRYRVVAEMRKITSKSKRKWWVCKRLTRIAAQVIFSLIQISSPVQPFVITYPFISIFSSADAETSPEKPTSKVAGACTLTDRELHTAGTFSLIIAG